MALFSQRIGLKQVEKALQKESMDSELRTDLWNALYLSVFSKYGTTQYGGLTTGGEMVRKVCVRLWLHYFKQPIDALPDYYESGGRGMSKRVRDYFFGAQWNEAYDFLEFIAKGLDDATELIQRTNIALERERAAYRFVGGEIAEIVSKEEIVAIETALTVQCGPVHTHLQRALELLADRKTPDFRNSVKESISAVEGECRRMSGNEKATLGEALTVIERTHTLHPAFKKALSALYGYTSDESGIRHALLEDDKVEYADAQYMLVACSAFINYLRLLSERN